MIDSKNTILENGSNLSETEKTNFETTVTNEQLANGLSIFGWNVTNFPEPPSSINGFSDAPKPQSLGKVNSNVFPGATIHYPSNGGTPVASNSKFLKQTGTAGNAPIVTKSGRLEFANGYQTDYEFNLSGVVPLTLTITAFGSNTENSTSDVEISLNGISQGTLNIHNTISDNVFTITPDNLVVGNNTLTLEWNVTTKQGYQPPAYPIIGLPGITVGLSSQNVDLEALATWSTIAEDTVDFPGTYSQSKSVSKGVSLSSSETQKFATTIGLEVSVGGSVAGIDLGAKLSSSFTTSKSNTHSITTTNEVTTEKEITVPSPGQPLKQGEAVTFQYWQLVLIYKATATSGDYSTNAVQYTDSRQLLTYVDNSAV